MLSTKHLPGINFMYGRIITLAIIVTIQTIAAQNHPTLDNTVICGYQGWFACYGDGSPVDRWNHWCKGQYRSDTPKPSPGNQSFEVYPDISEYPSNALFTTGYASLGDGRPAKLFSSYKEETINLHFKWMEDNAIDGAALQRFLSETADPVYKAHRDSVAVRVARAAEKTGRTFYIMYDGVGNNIDGLLNDWQNTMITKLRITSSPAYAYMNGKPVVCIWGFGFTHYKDTVTEALRAINWFRQNGYFVIGGVPTNWRTRTGDSKPDYEPVYKAFDMISPWTPGRYKLDTEIDNYKNNYLLPDKARLDSLNQKYQPVIFPGFAWSNWNGGAANAFPRKQGKFMWRQFFNVHSTGIKYLYIAMFDEYDEGTAIAKAASDYFDIPTNQYFQTMSCDGEFVSSDFYLRLTGAMARVLKTSMPATLQVPIAHSTGPVFYRTSFESSDAQPNWVNHPDSSQGALKNVVADTGSTPLCKVTATTAFSGSRSLHYHGKVSSAEQALAYFKVIKVSIPVVSTMNLSFYSYPQQELGRFVSIDLVTTDGTTLRDAGGLDTSGRRMHPATGRGTVNNWTKTVCPVGLYLNGKTIEKILLAFDHSGVSGTFSGFIDDISIYISNRTSAQSFSSQSGNYIKRSITLNSSKNLSSLLNNIQFDKVELYTLQGRIFSVFDRKSKSNISNMPNGNYILHIVGKNDIHSSILNVLK
jgi:hypothetical protein